MQPYYVEFSAISEVRRGEMTEGAPPGSLDMWTRMIHRLPEFAGFGLTTCVQSPDSTLGPVVA